MEAGRVRVRNQDQPGLHETLPPKNKITKPESMTHNYPALQWLSNHIPTVYYHFIPSTASKCQFFQYKINELHFHNAHQMFWDTASTINLTHEGVSIEEPSYQMGLWLCRRGNVLCNDWCERVPPVVSRQMGLRYIEKLAEQERESKAVSIHLPWFLPSSSCLDFPWW